MTGSTHRARARDLWSAWSIEERTAAVGAVLLIVSTVGPFSFVEGALLLVAGGVLWLLKSRGEGVRFELPITDGVLIVAAGAWSAVLIAMRLFDRPLGQSLLSVGCVCILVLAGLRAHRQGAAAEPSPRPIVDEPEAVVERPPVAAPDESSVRWLHRGAR